MQISIDPEFKSYLRTLTPEERSGLETGILRDGCLDPLRVWNNVLIDGHNRYEICTANNVPFDVEKITLADRNAAIDWIVDNQLSKRNLSIEEGSYLRGFKYNRQKKEVGRPEETLQNVQHKRTVEKVAEEAHVSPRTISNDGAFAAAVDKLVAATTPEARTTILRKETGLTRPEVIALAKAPEPVQKKILAAKDEKVRDEFKKHVKQQKTEATRARRVEKIAEAAKGNTPLDAPSRFPVLLADPPWRYEHVATESRAIENQYPTMNLDEICALPVYGVTTDDAILFMWTTSPKLDESLQVIKAWGFSYRTCAVWDKEVMGMGYYFRQQHELLLVATKGSFPTPAEADRPSSVFRERRAEHSKKPLEFYRIIERMYPELPKMEMFCRNARTGWHVWGNQAK